MKKRALWVLLAAALALTVSAGSTVAYLVSRSVTLENTFTYGTVDISLKETSGAEYIMAPGVTLFKDPVVTVKGGSESCWLFVKIQKSANFDAFCSFELQDGWTEFSRSEGLYCRKVSGSSVDLGFHVLRNDRVSVKDSVTEEQLNGLSSYPTLDFTAYAIQSDGFDNAHDAWEALDQ